MGLFSRTNGGGNGQDDFDDMDLPNSDDLKGGLFTSEESNTAAPITNPTPSRRSVAAPSTPRGSYGIEDAIKLMRALPRDNNEVVVTVVKKTLESTQIRVIDIVEDANQKETRIRDQHKTLEEEIKELQDQIAQRNHQITELLHDLKETTDVRQRLQLAMELDGEAQVQVQQQQVQAAPAPVEPTAPPVHTQTPEAPPPVNPAGDQNARRRAQHRNNPPH